MTDPDAFLMAGGAPAAKFETPGTVVKGRIVDAVVEDQTDFKSGQPLFYDNGKPMQQLVITLVTDQRDPTNPDDDGMRRLFAKNQMLAAIRDALKKVPGALIKTPGGTLAVQYTHDEPPPRPGLNPKKCYVAQYKPPADAADDLLNVEQPTAAPAPPAPAPAPTPPAAAAPPANGQPAYAGGPTTADDLI